MASLTGSRYNEQYTFRRVQWSNYQEHGSYDYILNGSIEMAVDSSLKVTGQFDFEGYEIPDIVDLIRVYYSFVDDNGEEFKRPLATFISSYASLNYQDTLDGLKAIGKLDGASILTVLQDRLEGAPYTVHRGDNAIYKAQQLCNDLGLICEVEPSSFSMPNDYSFAGGTSRLEIVNWLMDSAGYVPVFPDAMGRVVMVSQNTINNREYVPADDGLYPSMDLYPSQDLFPSGGGIKGVGYYFKNDSQSIMLPEIEENADWQTTPNVVRLLYNLDDACIVSEARNMSGSKASLNNRGNREMTLFEEVSVLGQGNKKLLMRDLAINRLLSISADVEVVQFRHAYVPLEIYDPIKIKYSDKSWEGRVDNITIELSPSTECQTKIKRILTNVIQVVAPEPQVLRGEDDGQNT